MHVKTHLDQHHEPRARRARMRSFHALPERHACLSMCEHMLHDRDHARNLVIFDCLVKVFHVRENVSLDDALNALKL